MRDTIATVTAITELHFRCAEEEVRTRGEQEEVQVRRRAGQEEEQV